MFSFLGWALFLINSPIITSTTEQLNEKVITYPTQLIAEWKQINVNEMDCYFGEFNPGMVGLTYKGYIVQDSNLIKADGTYCVAYRLTTTCWVNFFGIKSIKHNKIPISGIVDWVKVKGELDINIHTYPEPQCEWMKETKNESTILHCQAFPVQYDPVTGTFHDPIFEGNQAKCDSICTTRYPNRVWIPPAVSTIKPTLREIKFKIAKLEGEDIITGTYLKTVPISQLCFENYYGTLGLKYPDGFWFGVYGWTQNDSCIKLENNKFLQIPKCNNSIKLKSVTNRFKRFWEDQHIFQLSMYATCLITAEKIRVNKNLTYLDLALLSPTTPGRRPVYRIKNGSLESNIGIYQRIIWDPDGQSNRLGFNYDNKNETITFNDWVYHQDVAYGWNGLYKYRNSIELPNLALMTEINNFDFALVNSLKYVPEIDMQEIIDKYQEISDTLQIITITLLDSIKSHVIVFGSLILLLFISYISFRIYWKKKPELSPPIKTFSKLKY